MVPKLRFKEFCGEWAEFILKDVVDLRSEKYNPQKSDKNYKCIELEHLSQETGEIIGSISSLEQKSIKNKFYKDDILYGKLRPYLRKYAYCTFEGVCSSEIWVLNSTTLNNRLLFYYIQTNEFQSVANISSGTKMPRADWNKLKLKKIKVPSLPEQTKIADFLSTVDDKIQNQQDKITHLENIKKGFMQKIFSRKIRFKDDGGEEFPEWEEKKLKEIVTLNGRIGFRGYTVQDIVKKGEGAISLSPSNIIDGNIDIINTNLTYISMYKYNESPEIKIEKNDIVLTKTASVGRCGIVKNTDELMTINPQMVIIRSDNINMYFLNYQLNNQLIQKELFRRTVGGVVPTINQEEIYKIKIKVPCSKEQQKIVDFLSLFDEKISTEKETLEHLKQLKKGLLQQVFV